MTMNNKTKTSMILSTMMIALLAVMLAPNDAFASNVRPWEWSDTSQEYACTSSLDTITKTSNVSPCNDLATSSSVWNGISGSTWSIAKLSTGWPVYAWTTLPSGEVGRTVIYFNLDGTPNSAYIAINKNLSWENSQLDIFSSGYDYRSATGHEFGHLAGMDHSTSTGSVMYDPLGADQVRRNPDNHDKTELANKY